LLLLVAAASSAMAQPPGRPEVLKVEPPNWWVGHSLNPVRLMIRGRHLEGARVQAAAAGVQIGLTRVNERGTYLFVDLHVDPDARPGAVPLTLVGPGGIAQAPFELLAPLGREGRFQGFSEDDVIYLIMPDRFANGDTSNDDPALSRGLLDRAKSRYYRGGDLQGIIDRLPYLKDLGITAIWMNPIYDNNNRLNTREQYDGAPITDYHGYGAVDFYAVEERFGTLETLRKLVDAAHAHGIKVIQDQVANHTGPFHPWVNDSPTRTWYNGTEARHLANTFQTHLLMGPGVPAEVKRPTLDGWFINILPDLNQGDEEARRYIIQNSLWWVGISGLDAIRQDTLPYVPRDFWRDWMGALKREYPRLRVVGEVMDGSAPFVAFFQGGRAGGDGIDTGIDTLFDYPLFFGLRRAFAEGRSIREAVDVFYHDWLYPQAGRLVTLLGSHDVPRFMGERGATVEGLKLATTLVLTTRGTPQLYYGDEIAMPGGGDPDNRREFPGGFPGDARNAFEASGRTSEQQAAFAHTRALLHLRRDLEPLRRGRLEHLAIEDQAYAFARIGETGTVIVALNNAQTPATLDVDVAPAGAADGALLEDRLGVAPGARVERGRATLVLPARSSAVFTVRN
jgi:glycosidase